MTAPVWGDVRREAFTYYPRLARLQTFCTESFHEDISLQRAADIVGLERTYFSTYFHQKVGVCFKTWLTMVRVDQAKALLEAHNRAISSVAYEVGFNSLTTFERAFKRCTGTTAAHYKSQVRPC